MMRVVVGVLDELNEHGLHVIARDAKAFPESKILPIKIQKSTYNISLDSYSARDLLPIDFSQALDRMMIAIKYEIEIHKLLKKEKENELSVEPKEEKHSKLFLLADEAAEFRHRQFEKIFRDKSNDYIEKLLSKLISFVTVLQMLVENFPEDQKIKHQCKHLIDVQMQIYPFYMQRLKDDKKVEIEEYEKKICTDTPVIIKHTLALLKQELISCTDEKTIKNIQCKLKDLIAIGARFLFLTNESVNDLANDADTELEQVCHSLTKERRAQGEALLAQFRAIVPPKMTIPQIIVDANEPRLLANDVIEIERKKIIVENHLQYLWNKIHKLKGADKSQIGKKPLAYDLITYVGDENIKSSRLLNKFNIFCRLKDNLEDASLNHAEKLSVFNHHLKENRAVLIAHRDHGIEESARSLGNFFTKYIAKHEIFSKSEAVVLALEESQYEDKKNALKIQ